ncbi:MAG: helix-turn-helix transcriptional regulator [Spirochaetaceae bacterium]|jgi:transcriptional regulator with XRE-family HTH domain|nr:helix-turn-helix transcriptional regulator [Spirochaetaceae bacterium]
MDLDRLFVLNVKKWRRTRGFSQKILAERCNAAHSYIRQIESGSGKPSFAFIGKLARALDIEAYQLFYDETAAQTEKPAAAGTVFDAVKSEFLKKVSYEFDSAFDRLKK